MQAQDGPAEILFKLWPTLEKNKNTLIGVGVVVVVACGIWYFRSSAQAQSEVDAGLAFTTLMSSQAAGTTGSQMAGQYQQLAEKYSGTATAQRAQLQSAAVLFDTGDFTNAELQFQRFAEANSTGPFAATAQLGVAASLEAQGKLDLAATAYQRVIAAFPNSICLQPARFALGRIAEQQGKFSEALSDYQEVMQSPMAGSIAQEAQIRASDLKVKMDAAAAKMPASAKPAVPPANAPVPMHLTTPQPQTKP